MASEVHVRKKSRKRKQTTGNGGPPEKNASISVNSQAPRGINVTEFAEARALELHNMVEAISMADKTGRKRTCQSLPKHMRRRAVSHNVKRMPVRLRDAAKKEENNPTEIQLKPKKKSRRHRRKTRNLLDEYNRRKKQNIWLETHIWHAKRMKMATAWGYKLAEHPSDKGFRAGHRAVANSCLLQDISYYCCIEIKGYKHLIISAMVQITRKELGPTIASVEYMNSGKEGHTMLYHPHKYPYGAIGVVSFMWRQVSPDQTLNETESNDNLVDNAKLTQLWIWTHPSCYSEALEAIQQVCENVSGYENGSTVTSSDSFNIKCEENQAQDSNKELITVSSLRFDLARLRLTGPLAHPLLVELLELPVGAKYQSTEVKVTANNGVKEVANTQTPLQQESKVNDSNMLNPQDVWESLKSISCSLSLPPSVTLGLTVLDPRLGLPGKRTSIDAVVTNNVGNNINPLRSKLLHTKWPSYLAASGLWDVDTRIKAKEKKMDDQQLNNLRSNLLVPGTRLDLGEKASCIPMLLVQQQGSNGYGAGWDIILPSGWTMAFWIALVYRGARVGGLRESRNCSLESEVPYFPRDVPDTRAGMLHNEETGKESENKYARYPPNKRPNYHKLGITSPFKNPWGQLVKEWKLEAENLVSSLQAHVEDSSNVKSALSEMNNDCSTSVDNASGASEKIDSDSSLKKRVKKVCDDSFSSKKDSGLESKLPDSTIVDNASGASEKIDSDSSLKKRVKKVCNDSFSSKKDSGLESKLPDSQSFYVLRNISKLRDLRDMVTIVTEKQTKWKRLTDDDKLDLNPTYEMMKNNLHALIGVSLRMVNQGCPLPNATVSIPSRSDLELLQRSHKYGGPVEPLHKGPKRDPSKIVFDSDTMIGCCTRKVIGFVTSGQYSLSRGCGVGIAYCALPGLVHLLSQGQEGIVLVRNTTTQQYRLAFLTVL